MNFQPIKKKTYYAPNQPIKTTVNGNNNQPNTDNGNKYSDLNYRDFNESEFIQIYDLFTDFFKRINDNGRYTQIFKIANKYSTVDSILTVEQPTDNGIIESNIICEFKARDKYVYEYPPSSLIEFDKYNSIKETAKLLGCGEAYYIVYYYDAILIYDIDLVNGYKWQDQILPYSNTSTNLKTKLAGYIPFTDAKYIIGRRTMLSANHDQLNRYIEFKRPKTDNLSDSGYPNEQVK